MQVISFNFSKISAEKSSEIEKQPKINTHIEFAGIEKEKIDLMKETEIYRISFTFFINYDEKDGDDKKQKPKLGQISFQGNMVLSLGKNDPKDMAKALRKKEMPDTLREPLLNLIIRKCAAKAFDLEDQLGLPPHLSFPYVKIKPKK